MGKISFFKVVVDQWTTLPPVEKVDLSGKTVIVVGSNTGIGLEAARHFASMNPGRLILACRNVEKGKAALVSIRDSTRYSGGEVWTIDLTDFSSISAFANKFEKEGGGHLDILVENSGIATRRYEQTKDGWESTLQTNHLGTALLAILLLPHLSKSPAPRLVVVASGRHFDALLTADETSSPRILDKLNDAEHCDANVMAMRYPLSKLLNVFFVRAFAARLAPASPVVVDAVCPGLCRTELTRNLTFLHWLLIALMQLLLGRTAEQGGRLLVHAAVGGADGGRALHGRYVANGVVSEESDYVLSADGQAAEARLWGETIDILRQVDSRVPTIVSQYLHTAPSSRVF